MTDEPHVISEIYDADGSTSSDGGYVTTKFYFRPPAVVKQDADGDLVLERRGDVQEQVVLIKHSASTSLRLVGLQVWRGALLLADWALHNGASLRRATVLELGAGTGLTSVVAAMAAKEVISTDVDIGGILDLIRSNAALNSHFIKAKFSVLGLDFFAKEWSTELEDKLKEVSIILAADVIYDVDLTEAFIQALLKIMSIKPKKTLYFALEKRYVFTTDDLDSVAPVYEHFLSYFEHFRPKSWTMEQIPLTFPQYFHYERVKQLVLWKIES